MQQGQISKVEELYNKIQETNNGNVPWNEVPRHMQDTFMQALSILVQITSMRKQ